MLSITKIADFTKSVKALSINLVRQFVGTCLRYFPIRTQGFWLYVNSKDTGLAAQLITGAYESYVIEILRKIVLKGFVVCDVGAHVGYHTMILSRLVGSFGKVYSLEPDPENFKLLDKNIIMNKLKNVFHKRIAVSSRRGSARLFVSETDTTDHRLLTYNINNPTIQKRKYVKVTQDSLDNLLKKEKRVNLVKIDIQGSEVECLRGMRTLIRNNRDIKIIIEFWPEGLKQAGTDPGSLFKKIMDYKLKIYLLDEKNRKTRRIKSLDALLKLTGEKGFVNLLCRR